MNRFVYRIFRLILRTCCPLLFRTSRRYSHFVPKEGPFILACNHATWIDSLFLIAACPRPVRFVITKEFHLKPLVNMFTHNIGCIPLDKKKPRAAVLVAIKALRNGDSVCIYPEGGFTKDGSMRKIQRGVEVMARGAKCPVVPVVITGLFGSALAVRKEWRKEHLWKKPWPRVRITFGEPIGWEEISGDLVGEKLEELLRRP